MNITGIAAVELQETKGKAGQNSDDLSDVAKVNVAWKINVSVDAHCNLLYLAFQATEVSAASVKIPRILLKSARLSPCEIPPMRKDSRLDMLSCA